MDELNMALAFNDLLISLKENKDASDCLARGVGPVSLVGTNAIELSTFLL